MPNRHQRRAQRHGQETPEPPAPITHHEFSLADADGNSHEYVMGYHPGTDGATIMWQLAGMLAGPLGTLVKGLTEDLDFDKIDIDGNIKTEVVNLAQGALSGLDIGSVGHDLERILVQTDMVGLSLDILQFTTRDGMKVGQEIHFDLAYKANYLEYVKALWEVIQANRFFPRLDTAWLGKAVEMAKEAMRESEQPDEQLSEESTGSSGE